MGGPIEISRDEDTAFLSLVKEVFRWIRDSAKYNKNPCQYCCENNADYSEWSCGQSSFYKSKLDRFIQTNTEKNNNTIHSSTGANRQKHIKMNIELM